MRAPDYALLLAVATLLTLSVVMVASASLSLSDRSTGDPFHFLVRHGFYVSLGVALAAAVWFIPLLLWERSGRLLFVVGLLLLAVVLVPGVGKTVNGSVRWLPIGPFHLQVSEWVKLFAVVYMAGYVVRRHHELASTLRAFINPLILLGIACALVFLEPDLGAAVVIAASVFVMLFLGGARLSHLSFSLLAAVSAFVALVRWTPYRWARVTGFLDPWADPYNTGFQLSQALIAFGRGEWLGVGLGGSVQKLFYLPEAHTDFLLAVIGEELGLMGTLSVLAVFAFIVWRAFTIGVLAERAGAYFGAHLAYGIGTWIGLQAAVNMAVNMGALPTKGLTLPLMSFGGNSILVSCIAMALLLRVEWEARMRAPAPGVERDRWTGVC